jgi:hypothetical protein
LESNKNNRVPTARSKEQKMIPEVDLILLALFEKKSRNSGGLKNAVTVSMLPVDKHKRQESNVV